ncbi:unnamed protein product, partial [Ascophyllum nodosum]
DLPVATALLKLKGKLLVITSPFASGGQGAVLRQERGHRVRAGHGRRFRASGLASSGIGPTGSPGFRSEGLSLAEVRLPVEAVPQRRAIGAALSDRRGSRRFVPGWIPRGHDELHGASSTVGE